MYTFVIRFVANIKKALAFLIESTERSNIVIYSICHFFKKIQNIFKIVRVALFFSRFRGPRSGVGKKKKKNASARVGGAWLQYHHCGTGRYWWNAEYYEVLTGGPAVARPGWTNNGGCVSRRLPLLWLIWCYGRVSRTSVSPPDRPRSIMTPHYMVLVVCGGEARSSKSRSEYGHVMGRFRRRRLYHMHYGAFQKDSIMTHIVVLWGV